MVWGHLGSKIFPPILYKKNPSYQILGVWRVIDGGRWCGLDGGWVIGGRWGVVGDGWWGGRWRRVVIARGGGW